jgi:hypothetical protein
LPRVASVAPERSRIAAVISLTVVLPLLPATPTMGIENCARHAAADSDNASLRVAYHDLRQTSARPGVDHGAGRTARFRRRRRIRWR